MKKYIVWRQIYSYLLYEGTRIFSLFIFKLIKVQKKNCIYGKGRFLNLTSNWFVIQPSLIFLVYLLYRSYGKALKIPYRPQSARSGFIECDEKIGAFKKAHFNFGRRPASRARPASSLVPAAVRDARLIWLPIKRSQPLPRHFATT